MYFQPPDNSQMEYPAIVYSLDNQTAAHADNRPYSVVNRYQITVIDQDPDSPIPMRIAHIPKTTFNRAFRSDRLNHTVYNTFF